MFPDSDSCQYELFRICCFSDRFFEFCKGQVQVILFRECDFRGRRLLFDSNSIKKIPINNQTEESTEEPKTEKYVEVSNGFGYLVSRRKPNTTYPLPFRFPVHQTSNGHQTNRRDDLRFGCDELPRHILQDPQPKEPEPADVHAGLPQSPFTVQVQTCSA